ncbi:DMP19 family protein [Aquisphaera insulae]|uniref:DMP19 family protein n=1 Tax=Aquisphaera insulae TaxID=2712864 RepID=UPI0013EC2CAB|nr:DUF4375 domain-containing protein [Aquisphaera insulae]
MKTRKEAIVHLKALGFSAGEWDSLQAGSIYVTTRPDPTSDDCLVHQGRSVVVYPTVEGWGIKGPPEGAFGPSEVEPSVYGSLDEAVEAAAAFVAAGGGPLTRISRDLIDRILDNPDPERVVSGIGMCIEPRDESDPELGLSRPEMNFCSYQTYNAEVFRNGHAWFFLNPSGGEVARILTAFEEMGLDGPRAILLEACSVFPDARVPASREDRIEAIKALPYKETMALWSRLDREYSGDWDLERSVKEQVARYLREHRAEVLKPETNS